MDSPDCGSCLETKSGDPLLPENYDAWRVYEATKSQLIISPMGGPISINQLAVWEWIDRYKIKNPIKVFEQVCNVSAKIISDRNEDARLEREAKGM